MNRINSSISVQGPFSLGNAAGGGGSADYIWLTRYSNIRT